MEWYNEFTDITLAGFTMKMEKIVLIISLLVTLAVIIGACLLIPQKEPQDPHETTDGTTRVTAPSAQETEASTDETQTYVSTEAVTEPMITGNGYFVLIHEDGTFTVVLPDGEERTFERRSTTYRDLERIQKGMTFFDAVACGGIPNDGGTSGMATTRFTASDGSSCLVYWTHNDQGEKVVSSVISS